MRLLSGAAAEPKEWSRGEDAYFIHSDWIGVADGVGSSTNSGEYSKELMAHCMDILASEPDAAKDGHKGLLKVIARAKKKTVTVSSSTVVLAGGLADGKNILHVANMGDSACLVIRNGRVLARTTPQLESPNCPYQICNENDPFAPYLGRCTDLGQVLKVPVQLGDVVVCATDGLWDSVTEEKVVLVSSAVIRDGASPQTVAGILLILSKGGWKPDDTTIVVSLVVDDGTAQILDEHVWATQFVKFAPGIAAMYRDFFTSTVGYLQYGLEKMLEMGDERHALGNDFPFHLILKFRQKRAMDEQWERKKQKPDLDLELPAELKQLLDDYACGKLTLAKFKDTELVSCEDGKPNLLLSHLPAGLNIDFQELNKNNHLVMLTGGRGSGKTKLLYTYLCSEGGGLYFTARSAEEHWGSADLDYLVKEVLCSIRPKRPQGRRNERYLTSSFEDLPMVTSRLKLLLGARLKIYAYCKDKMSNTQWLLLQAGCRALVDSDGVRIGEAGDVFKAFLAHLCRQEIPDDHPLLRAARTTMRTCVIDDVEQCRMALHGCFTEGGDCAGLGFARALRDFFGKLESRVVFSGACRDQELLEKRLSFSVPRVFARGCWKNADEAIQYSEQVLHCKLSEGEAEFMRTCVFERFKGRFAPFVTMLEVMLAKGLDMRDAAEYVERGYTTEEGVPEITTSFCKSIAASPQACQAYIGWSSLERFAFGAKPRAVPPGPWGYSPVNELFEWGFTRLADANDGATICDEYLVIKAYQNMRGIMSVDWMHPVVPKVRLPLDAESIVNYDFVPFCMLRMWKEYKGVLQDMPVFAELLQAEDCPLQLKCLSRLQSAFLVDDGCCISPEMKPDKFFSEEQALNRRFLFWSAENPSSSSAAGKIVFGDAPGTRVGYFHHVHHPEKRIWQSKVDVEDETLVEMEPGVDWAEQQAIPDVYFCFVIFHPRQSLSRLPHKWSFKEVAPGKLKVTVVLGMENMELVFTEGEVNILKEVIDKKGRHA